MHMYQTTNNVHVSLAGLSIDKYMYMYYKRSNHLITHDGKTQTIAEWAAELGLNYDTLYSRIVKYKWDIHKALTTP